MRINKYVALATGMSRRAADEAIANGLVLVNGIPASPGFVVAEQDTVTFKGQPLQLASIETIIMHKPVGYVVSRDGQGSKTIYDLLPEHLHHLKPVGRLDKDSSGLLLMTNDGQLANQLTHPSSIKQKRYDITLDGPLQPLHHQMLADYGVQLDDGPSKFDSLLKQSDDALKWEVTMHEGRNRQIRRSFAALGYTVVKLHRTQFGAYNLSEIKSGKYQNVL